MIDLANVDNTSDLSKPISTATSAALALKANLAGPTTFSGTTTVANLTAQGTVTIPDNALTIPKISGLQADLNARVRRYVLPDAGGTEQWCQLGTLTTTQTSRICQINVVTQNSVGNFLRANLYFTSSNDVDAQLAYDNSTPVFCFADLQTTSNIWGYAASDFAVTQISKTIYSFSLKLRVESGFGFFTVMTSSTDTFAYGGTLSPSWPPNASINPTMSNITPGMIGAGTQADMDLKAPLESPSFTGTLSAVDMNVSGSATFANSVFNGASTINANLDVKSTNTSRFLTIDALGAGSASWLTMKAPGLTAALTNNGTVFRMEAQTLNKNLDFRVVNGSSATLTPLQIYANGVVNVGNSASANKMLALHENAAADTPSTAVNFYGFGVNTGSSATTGTLRYQVPAAGNFHRFWCGTTNSYTINNTGGQGPSDARFKSELRPIENALEKIVQLQGKTFKMHDNEAREMGFIAQQLLPIVPEVVWID